MPRPSSTSPASPTSRPPTPILSQTAEINLVGTLQSIEAALSLGITRYLFASTVYVYSDLGGFYRASKQACEAFIEAYGQERGLDYTILRYGTLYGRRAGPTNRIHSMIASAVRSSRISYPGSGEALRDFIHVRDAARITVRTLDPAYIKRHLLITGQERMRVKDVALMIAEILPGEGRARVRRRRAGGPLPSDPLHLRAAARPQARPLRLHRHRPGTARLHPGDLGGGEARRSGLCAGWG